MPLFIELAANFYDAFIGVWFVMKFNKSAFKNSKLFIPFVLLIFGVSTIYTFITDFSVLHSVIIFIVLLVYAFTIKRTKLITRIIAPIIFELVLIIVNTSIIFVLSNVLSVDFGHILSISFYGRYLHIFLCKFVMTTVLVIINRIVTIEDHFSISDFMLYLFSPSVAVVILYLFMKLGDDYDISKYTYLIVGVTLSLALINVSTLSLFRRAISYTSARYELEIINNRNNVEEERYKELCTVYSQLQVTRHDIRDHLMYIDCLISKKEYDKIHEYISNKNKELDLTKRYCYTNNRMVDYIIDAKLSQRKDITLIITGKLENIESIDNLDLCTLFGNLLSNAIEAVEQCNTKQIELQFNTHDVSQSIVCRNTICNSVMKNNPDLITTKSDKSKHGYGIKSIKNIVKKYDGLVEFYEDDGMFNVCIVLPIEDIEDQQNITISQ